MTVKELVEQLLRFKPSMTVYIENMDDTVRAPVEVEEHGVDEESGVKDAVVIV